MKSEVRFMKGEVILWPLYMHHAKYSIEKVQGRSHGEVWVDVNNYSGCQCYLLFNTVHTKRATEALGFQLELEWWFYLTT